MSIFFDYLLELYWDSKEMAEDRLCIVFMILGSDNLDIFFVHVNLYICYVDFFFFIKIIVVQVHCFSLQKMYMLCNDEEVFIPNTSAKSMPFRMIIIELFMMYVHVFKNMRNLLISAKVGLSMLKKKRLIKFSNGTICSLLWYVFHNMYTGILKWVHVTLRFWLFRGINYNFGFIKTWIGVRNLLFLSKKNFNAEMFNILCALYQISKGDQN